MWSLKVFDPCNCLSNTDYPNSWNVTQNHSVLQHVTVCHTSVNLRPPSQFPHHQPHRKLFLPLIPSILVSMDAWAFLEGFLPAHLMLEAADRLSPNCPQHAHTCKSLFSTVRPAVLSPSFCWLLPSSSFPFRFPLGPFLSPTCSE